MKLMFLLHIDGHLGFPDSEWETEGVLESDAEESVLDRAQALVKAHFRKRAGDRVDETRLAKLRISFEYGSMVMAHEDEDHKNYLNYKVTPVLSIGERYFELKEIEI